MGKIEDLIGKKPKKMVVSESKIEMGGAFSCQTCNQVVSEAEYNREEYFVFWTCTEGHLSRVNLG
jgi:hypothetical protein